MTGTKNELVGKRKFINYYYYYYYYFLFIYFFFAVGARFQRVA